MILRASLVYALVLGLASPASADAPPFAIKDGDKIAFYGDSITAREIYTPYLETYIVTRFPSLNVSFINAGVDGDQVTGGRSGSIDERIQRDVIDYNPTMVTVMLGMNDAVLSGAQTYDQSVYDAYVAGYQHLLALLKVGVPGARLTLIEPSPYDDMTRDPGPDGGFNHILILYGAYVRELAHEIGALRADMNTPVAAALQKAMTLDPAGAMKLIPDRLHPSPQCGVLLAEALLKAWNAPAYVSIVELDAGAGRVTGVYNATVDKLEVGNAISWTQLEASLPMPISLKDPVMALVVQSSDVEQALNQEVLKVAGLTSPQYDLKIDGKKVARLNWDKLAAGVNLAELPTPMIQQAMHVLDLTKTSSKTYSSMMHLVNNASSGSVAVNAFEHLKTSYLDSIARRKQAAKPVPHAFELVPVPAT